MKCDFCDCEKDEHFGEKGRCNTCWADITKPKCMAFRAPKVRSTTKRRWLKPVSDHRAGVNIERQANLVAAWGPQPTWRCLFDTRYGTRWSRRRIRIERVEDGPLDLDLPACYGAVAAHEVLSRQRAGQTDANITDVGGMLPMCNLHNGWIENWPIESKLLGFARSYSKELS